MAGLHRCPTCPRRHEPDVRWAGSSGPETSPILFIGMAPGNEELLAGQPFVGASGRIMRKVCGEAGFSFEDARVINCINCYPAKRVGKRDEISRDQFVSCRARFEQELRASAARIIVPLGGDALWYLTGLKGPDNGIGRWRGYPIPKSACKPVKAWPSQKLLKEGLKVENLGEEERQRLEHALARAKDKGVLLPPRTEWILPTLHPSYIMRTRFTRMPYLTCDIQRVARALNHRLRLLAVEGPGEPLADAGRSTGPLAIDIETVGHTTTIERIGYSWEVPSP